MPPGPKTKQMRIVAYLPFDKDDRCPLWERLRAEAFRQHKSISGLAGEYIAKGLEREQKAG